VVLLAGLCACVGSETYDDRGEPDVDRTRPRETPEVRAIYEDTVAPVGYQLFEVEPDEREPKKVTYRLMALEVGRLDSMTKTVRLALDSLQRADTSLVAVRAVLYVFQPTARMEGKLVPAVWGEWVPPEGWDAAVGTERQRFHRSYVYAVNPGWSRPAAVEDE